MDGNGVNRAWKKLAAIEALVFESNACAQYRFRL